MPNTLLSEMLLRLLVSWLAVPLQVYAFYRTLENEKIDALKENHGDFDATDGA